MCLECTSESEVAECPYDADEHSPAAWPADATREDYPDRLPEPSSWSDTRHKPYDSNGRLYNPYQGSQSQVEGRCNAPLTNWAERYGEMRYCTAMPESAFIEDGRDFCKHHKSRADLHANAMTRAKELLKHGMYAQSIRHVFESLGPWEKVIALGLYDSYLTESTYDFDAQFEAFTVDFAESDRVLPIEVAAQVDADDTMSVDVPVPQAHAVRAFALYRAAIADMKTSLADREVLGGDDDEAAMEREVVETVTDEGRAITDLDEHHLNLAISRVDKDREKLLSFGGVPVDGTDADAVSSTDVGDIVLDLDADATAREHGELNPVEEQMVTDADDANAGGDAASSDTAVGGSDGDPDGDARET